MAATGSLVITLDASAVTEELGALVSRIGALQSRLDKLEALETRILARLKATAPALVADCLK